MGDTTILVGKTMINHRILQGTLRFYPIPTRMFVAEISCVAKEHIAAPLEIPVEAEVKVAEVETAQPPNLV